MQQTEALPFFFSVQQPEACFSFSAVQQTEALPIFFSVQQTEALLFFAVQQTEVLIFFISVQQTEDLPLLARQGAGGGANSNNSIIVVFCTKISMFQLLHIACLLSGGGARILDRGGSNRKGLQLRKGDWTLQ